MPVFRAFYGFTARIDGATPLRRRMDSRATSASALALQGLVGEVMWWIEMSPPRQSRLERPTRNPEAPGSCFPTFDEEPKNHLTSPGSIKSLELAGGRSAASLAPSQSAFLVSGGLS